MTVEELQQALTALGCYTDLIDNIWGKMTRAAVMEALTDGPDTRLTDADFTASAQRLSVPEAAVRAVASVEASSSGFLDGRPVLLFEPHRFSKATGHRFDLSQPGVSYPKWDRAKYPRRQSDRYAQLLTAVALDVDAGFASASYGMFQPLGENFKLCGFASPFAMAVGLAQDEAAQLRAFEAFVSNTGLVRHLRLLEFGAFALGYNGTAARLNHYPERLSDAYAVAAGLGH